MKCPFCGSLNNKVLDSRVSREGSAVRRRRLCPACGNRFTTYEKVEEQTPILIKRDGRREIYNRDKLKRGIMAATQKRPVAIAAIDTFIEETERRLQDSNYKEISTNELGEKVMEFLKGVDLVAYIRFASVYKNFNMPDDFEREARQAKDEAHSHVKHHKAAV
jgi:transcriptional repressor NrdR